MEDLNRRIRRIPTVSIVEHNQAAFIGMAWFNPLHVMLSEELLVTGQALMVNLGVSPSIENIAALPCVSTGVACCFFGRCAVVNDVYLVHAFA